MAPTTSMRLWIALAIVTTAAMVASVVSATTPSRVLRVCADPNNMPFSNARGDPRRSRPAARSSWRRGAPYGRPNT
jgi:hypothetical protein